jgi:hypothetical protein
VLGGAEEVVDGTNAVGGATGLKRKGEKQKWVVACIGRSDRHIY